MENRGPPLALAIVLVWLSPARAHFQELIPTPDLVTPETGRQVTLEAVFTHPFARGPVMDMAPPARFGVLADGISTDLTRALEPFAIDGRTAYRATHTPPGPGDYVYYLEPAPYWEQGEGKTIVHYTKVVVDAYGGEDGWDASVGLPVEIEPLTRPYGLWTGNVFRGLVRHEGVPVPFTTVEVEWRNDGSVSAPADVFTTQVIKADGEGVFTYAMPRAGWWGFAALVDGPPLPGPDGADAESELGGLIWVRTVDMTERGGQHGPSR